VVKIIPMAYIRPEKRLTDDRGKLFVKKVKNGYIPKHLVESSTEQGRVNYECDRCFTDLPAESKQHCQAP
jgi:hypothetical protein